jgi:multidrug transporter EmrE-like cation transporter
MNQAYIAIVLAVLLSLIGVTGDSFLKIASQSESIVKNQWFLFGLFTLASTAFGWVYIIKYLKLATVGVIYSVCTVVFLALVGSVFFQETLNPYEIIGILLAIASLVLLSAFG